MDRNLTKAQITIYRIEEGMASKPFKHLISERKGEMIFPGGLIQSSVIDTYTTPSDSLSRNEFVTLILDGSHAPLFRHYLD